MPSVKINYACADGSSLSVDVDSLTDNLGYLSASAYAMLADATGLFYRPDDDDTDDDVVDWV